LQPTIMDDNPLNMPPDSLSPSTHIAPVVTPEDLDVESLLPFLTSLGISANTIATMANKASTCSQQSLEIAAHCRVLVEASNAWVVSKPGSGTPSNQDLDAAKGLESTMSAVKAVISERVTEQPSNAGTH